MGLRLIITLAVMLTTVCGVLVVRAQGPISIPQTKVSYEEVFHAVWQTVNDNFYDPNFEGVDWRAVREGYRPRVAKVRNDNEFYELMRKMLKELPVSHLEFGMPVQQGSVGVGARTHTIEGQQVITSVTPASDAQRQGLRTGDIILTPENVPGTIGSKALLRVRGCDGRERTVEVRREAQGQPERPSLRWRTIGIGPGMRIGYLRAVRFDDDVAPAADAAMADLRNTAGLIIDVRDNSGGNTSFIRLSSYFGGGQHLVFALLTRPYLERLRRAPEQIDPAALPKAVGAYTDAGVFEAMRRNGGAVSLYSEDFGEKGYRGKVVVLINESTGSAAEGFAWHMMLETKATLIGRATAGVLLGAEYYTLPGGWRLSVPTHAGWGPDGKPVIDKPVSPHVETRWALRDVCDGRDPDITKALDVLLEGK